MNPSAQTATPAYTLTCRMQWEAAALERLCQVVRVRGFRIAGMAVESRDDRLDIRLSLQGHRPIAMLKAQLEKLHTVDFVAAATREPADSTRSREVANA